MKPLMMLSLLVALAGLAYGQSAIPDDPNVLFEEGAAAPTAAPAPVAAPPLAKAVEIGGTLYSDYTAFLDWKDSYPDPGHLSAGTSTLFAPNLQADIYLDARPFDTVRVFAKLRAVSPYTYPQVIPGTPTAAGISLFELYADAGANDRLYVRVGQQVVNWGVGYFFSPADIISLTPIDPLRPDLVRPGPLALKMNVPFADVDNFYLYLVANQGFQPGDAYSLEDLAIAARIEVLLGGWEMGLGGYYQRSQRPKAMVTATGSLFGRLGLFAEGVVSQGMDRTRVQQQAGAPGSFQTFIDTTTPTVSGTVGARWMQSDWHILLVVQYFYNGQGYTDAAAEGTAMAAYSLQQQGTPPVGPLLYPTDVFQPGMHYLAGRASWTDILASKVDLALFAEANLGDGSGVVSPSISYTPFRGFMLTFAPYISYGADGTELVSMFGRFSLSLKLTVATGSF
jgi:hypothetical protein